MRPASVRTINGPLEDQNPVIPFVNVIRPLMLRVPLPYENTDYGKFSFEQAVGNLDEGLLVFRNWKAGDSGRDIHLTYDGGRTWTRINTEFAKPFTHFVPLGSNRWLGLSLNRQWPSEAWESSDGIKWSWRATGYGIERGGVTLVKAIRPDTVVAYLGNGKLWRTTNGGPVPNSVFSNNMFASVAV